MARCRVARFWVGLMAVCGNWLPPALAHRIEPICVAPVIPFVEDMHGNFSRYYTWTEMRMVLIRGFNVPESRIGLT